MAQKNNISVTITPADKQAILKHFTDSKQLLGKALIFNLSPNERKELAKMGDKTLAFVGKAIDYAAKNPALVPPYLNVPEAVKDFSLVSDLKEISHELAILCQAVDDTLMVAGSEAYNAALIFHASVKGASRSDTPGSTAIYEDLVQRFPKGGRKRREETAVKTTV